MIIRFIARLIAILNSNTRPFEVGAGVAFGFALALVPGGNLLYWALFLVLFLVKVNLGLALVSLAVLRLVMPLADPLVEPLGYWILTRPGLDGLFTSLASTPIVPFTRFNDALVMGALATAIVLWLPIALLATCPVRLYRLHLHPRIAGSRLVQAIKATPIAQKVGRLVGGFRQAWSPAG